MSQSTAIDHSLREEESRAVRAEGEDGKQNLAVKDRQLQLLESIDASLKTIAFLLEKL